MPSMNVAVRIWSLTIRIARVMSGSRHTLPGSTAPSIGANMSVSVHRAFALKHRDGAFQAHAGVYIAA